MKRYAIALAGAFALALTGCSDQTAPPAAESKVIEKPVPVTGQSGLFRMYQMARSWSPDLQILKAGSVRLAEVPDEPGKSGEWEAMFVSPARAAARSYTWSAVEIQPDLHKGAFAGPEQSYTAHGDAKPFLIAAVKVDTDAALATAKTKAVEYEAKFPGKPITYVLEQPQRFSAPAWRVIWGESASTSNFSVYVDAMTGQYLETMH